MINERVREQLQQVGERINTIDKIILFGSRAIGDHEEKSDIDLAFVAPKMTQEEWTELTFVLKEELDTLLFLDLIKHEEALKELKNEIITYGEIIYAANSSYKRKTS